MCAPPPPVQGVLDQPGTEADQRHPEHGAWAWSIQSSTSAPASIATSSEAPVDAC
jgi:hypothetical protein